MKLITAAIRPERLDDVLDSLDAAGLRGVTVTAGAGRAETTPTRTEVYKGVKIHHRLGVNVRLEVLVDERDAVGAIRAITCAGFSGTGDDGLVWTTDLDSVMRIKDKVVGAAALSVG